MGGWGQAGRCDWGVGAFGTEKEYGAFLLARLRPGSRLVAVAGGRKGEFVRTDGSDDRPCLVKWDGSGEEEWVNWRDVELEVLLHALLHLLYTCSALGSRARGPHVPRRPGPLRATGRAPRRDRSGGCAAMRAAAIRRRPRSGPQARLHCRAARPRAAQARGDAAWRGAGRRGG